MATRATVASTTTATTLIAENQGARGVIVTNDDANALYVLIGAGTVSSTNYDFKLDQGEDACIPGCREKLSGVWAADGSGNAYVSQYS